MKSVFSADFSSEHLHCCTFIIFPLLFSSYWTIFNLERGSPNIPLFYLSEAISSITMYGQRTLSSIRITGCGEIIIIIIIPSLLQQLLSSFSRDGRSSSSLLSFSCLFVCLLHRRRQSFLPSTFTFRHISYGGCINNTKFIRKKTSAHTE